ncbi:MAG: hypothetical protein WCG40_11265 [Actinomycetes bacterium]
MASIKYKHSYDLAWQICCLLGGGLSGYGIYEGARLIISDNAATVVGWIVLFPVLFLLISIPVDTYLYIRFDLKTPISFRDARKLKKIFQGHAVDTWLPHDEVLSLPREQRRAYLFEVLAKQPFAMFEQIERMMVEKFRKEGRELRDVDTHKKPTQSQNLDERDI